MLGAPLALLLAMSWTTARAQGGAAPSDGADPGAQVDKVLETLQEGADARQRADVLQALVRLGPETILAQLDALRKVRQGPRRDLPRRSLARGVLLDSLARFPALELSHSLQSAIVRDEPAGTRAAAFEVLGSLGTPFDLERSIQAVGAMTDEDASRGRAARELGGAVGAVFARHPERISGFGATVGKAPRWLHRDLVLGLADTGTPEALEELLGMLVHQRGLDELALAGMSDVLERLGGPQAEEVADQIRWSLDGFEPEALRHAALCAGWLGDAASAARLISLLDHEQAGVRQAAHLALKRIGRVDLRPDRSLWEVWHRQQLEWRARRAPGLVSRIRAGDAPDLAPVFHELGSYTLFRHELAREIAPALGEADPRLRRLAAMTLGRLGSRVACPALEQALEDPDAEVRQAAEGALAAIATACSPSPRATPMHPR